jgi:TetR/AcrR family transcriptional regulator, mexJK operon transcriptional repressor
MRASAITPSRTRATITIVGEEGPARSLPGRRPGGRPPRSAALKLRDHILDVATDLFLTQGYGLTTIEAVARRARISKRTFYHRFADKPALFGAVVHRVIDRMRPAPGVPLLEGATVHDQLRRLAQMMLRAALSPPAIALHRLLIAESARFPELAQAVDAEGASREAVALISGLLSHEIKNPAFSAQAREIAAQQFIQLVVSIPQRRAMGFGEPMSSSEVDSWADTAVTLLLNGCRGWGCTGGA